MEEIEAEIVAGRYAIACRNLDRLLSWKADPNGGIVYLLGSCELARGRNQAAREAWARVLPGSAFSERAIRGRMRLLQESGQLAAAERLIHDAAGDPRNDRTALLVLLVPMFHELGRSEEAERLIEDRWEDLNALGEGALEPAIKLLRQHIELSGSPPRSKTPGPFSTTPLGWLRRTIGAGWVERTWRSGRATTTRPGGVWMPVSSADLMTSRSGAPG